MAAPGRLPLVTAVMLGAALLVTPAGPASAERPSGRFFDLIDSIMQQVPGHRDNGNQTTQGSATSGPLQSLADNWNPQGCEFTDSSQFTLSRPTRIDRIDLWYNWSPGENSTGFSLVGANGQSFARGDLRRDSCDPYQGAWCVATVSPRIVIPAGRYRVVAARPRVCQNAASGRSGFIRAWGSAATASTSRPVSQGQPGMALGTRWAIHEEVPGGRHWDGYWTRRQGSNTFDARWRDSESGQYLTDVIELSEVRGSTVRLVRRGTGGTYTGRIGPDGISISGSASWYGPGAFWTGRIEN